jgi:hypothetical protein
MRIPFKVSVSEIHIKSGIRTDCSRCPIALAIKDVLENESEISVGLGTLKVYEGGVTRHYELPSIAKSFISSFDSKLSVEPFEFEITEGLD